MITSAPSRSDTAFNRQEQAMIDRLGTALSGEEISLRSNPSRLLVLHSPSTTFFLTKKEAHRLLHELEMALAHPRSDILVVADTEMRVDEASELLRTLRRSLMPTRNWVRFGF